MNVLGSVNSTVQENEPKCIAALQYQCTACLPVFFNSEISNFSIFEKAPLFSGLFSSHFMFDALIYLEINIVIMFIA